MADSFRDAGHLPKRRPDGRAPDPAALPRQRRGRTPQMHGRYPDYDVLEQQEHWDALTRRVVLARVHDVPPIRFFTPAEAATLGVFLDVVLAQDAEPRVPVLAMVDAKLHAGHLDGYRYEDMPADPRTWQLVAAGLDHEARRRGATSFAGADPHARHAIVQGLADGELSGGPWDELNVGRAWSVVMRAALGAFYSHPWAWNEIGFGGPAYPRGYMRRRVGAAGREPDEAPPAVAVDPVQARRPADRA